MKLFQQAVIIGTIATAVLAPTIASSAQTNAAAGSIIIMNATKSTTLYVKCGPSSPSKVALPIPLNSKLGPLAYGLINILYFGGSGTGVCGFYSDTGYSNLVGEAAINLNIAPSTSSLSFSNIAQGYSAVATTSPTQLTVAIAGK